MSIGKLAAGPRPGRYYNDQVAQGREDYYAARARLPACGSGRARQASGSRARRAWRGQIENRVQHAAKPEIQQPSSIARDGETRTRTGDTTIFSRGRDALQLPRNPCKSARSQAASLRSRSAQFALFCRRFGHSTWLRCPIRSLHRCARCNRAGRAARPIVPSMRRRDPEGVESAAIGRLVDRDGRNVLEAGCGGGRLTTFVSSRAASVYAFDRMRPTSRRLRPRSPPRCATACVSRCTPRRRSTSNGPASTSPCAAGRSDAFRSRASCTP